MDEDKTRRLTDSEWAFVKDELVKAGASCCRHPQLRGIVDALLWLGTHQTSWAGLPSEFPPYATCYGAFYRWRLAGQIQPIFKTLNAPLPVPQAAGVKKRLPDNADLTRCFRWFPGKEGQDD